jgi:hemerythrin-like domain-containing protein
MESLRTHAHSSPPARANVPVDNHEYVDASCATLTRLAEYIPQWGMNKTAREVAGTLCGYFDVEFRHHREEQEQGLFPALKERARGDDAEAVGALINRLTAEHALIEQAWHGLRSVLNDIAMCRPARLSTEEVARFATLYQNHLANEDAQLMTMGARILGLHDLRLMVS